MSMVALAAVAETAESKSKYVSHIFDEGGRTLSRTMIESRKHQTMQMANLRRCFEADVRLTGEQLIELVNSYLVFDFVMGDDHGG